MNRTTGSPGSIARRTRIVIHSAQGGNDVQKRITKFWNKQKGPSVLICTHKAAMDLEVPYQARDSFICLSKMLDMVAATVVHGSRDP